MITLEIPEDLALRKLPSGVDARLQALLDKQDSDQPLSKEERAEAEGLVDLAEWLSLLRIQSGLSQ